MTRNNFVVSINCLIVKQKDCVESEESIQGFYCGVMIMCSFVERVDDLNTLDPSSNNFWSCFCLSSKLWKWEINTGNPRIVSKALTVIAGS